MARNRACIQKEFANLTLDDALRRKTLVLRNIAEAGADLIDEGDQVLFCEQRARNNFTFFNRGMARGVSNRGRARGVSNRGRARGCFSLSSHRKQQSKKSTIAKHNCKPR